jgi:hypothetical protein
MPWLARGIGISTGPVRESVRRLVVLGALRLIRRSKAGHVIGVRLPDEIRGLRPGLPAVAGAIAVCGPARQPQSLNLEELDFLKTRARAGRNSYRNLVSCCLECNSLGAGGQTGSSPTLKVSDH